MAVLARLLLVAVAAVAALMLAVQTAASRMTGHWNLSLEHWRGWCGHASIAIRI
jgi:hypothetical protein